MVVTLGQQYHVGEKPSVILCTYINRHAETPNKPETKDTMSLDTTQCFYMGSGIEWVSALLYYHIISHQVNYRLTIQEKRLCALVIIRRI